MQNDLLHLIALQNVPLVGPKTARELIAHCGSAEAVFKTKPETLLKIPNVGAKISKNIQSFQDFSVAEKELKFIEKKNILAFTYLNKDYPHRLKHFDDAPLVLYKKGKGNLNPHRSVAIVGTRSATASGKLTCEEIIEGLKEYNVTIFSGLAFGIDITAHRKSIDLEIPTFGVLAHGLDRIYPQRHRKTAEQMLETGGLLTEYTTSAKFIPDNFKSRNRIIAGLCDALVVVETGIKGGSIISAIYANEYNKDVFAVPGRLNDQYAQGCNRLIKTHKAALLESAYDIGYIMRWEKVDGQTAPVQRKLFTDLSKDEKRIVDLLRDNEGLTMDKLTFELKMNIGSLTGLLLEMEFKGIVQTLPGSRYGLIR